MATVGHAFLILVFTILLKFVGPSYLTSTMGGNIRWVAAELFEEPDDGEAAISLSTECEIYSFGSIFLQVSSWYFQVTDLVHFASTLGANLQGTLLHFQGQCCAGTSHQRKETKASQRVTAGACALGVHTTMLVTPCKSSIGWRNRSVCST
jgi:hypothetical protein